MRAHSWDFQPHRRDPLGIFPHAVEVWPSPCLFVTCHLLMLPCSCFTYPWSLPLWKWVLTELHKSSTQGVPRLLLVPGMLSGRSSMSLQPDVVWPCCCGTVRELWRASPGDGVVSNPSGLDVMPPAWEQAAGCNSSGSLGMCETLPKGCGDLGRKPVVASCLQLFSLCSGLDGKQWVN